MIWADGTGQRTGTIVSGGRRFNAGRTVQLRVRGGHAALNEPAWEGYGTLIAGLVALVAGGIASVRMRRRRQTIRPGEV